MKKIVFPFYVFFAVTELTAAIYYVREGGAGDGSSWLNASGDIQATLDAAALASDDSNQQDVWVSEGEYPPIVITGNVNVYGGFSVSGGDSLDDRATSIFKTVINGDINGDDYDFDNDGYPEAFRDDNVGRVVDKRTSYEYVSEPHYPPFVVAYPTVFDGFYIRGGEVGISSSIDNDYSTLRNLVLERNELGASVDNVTLDNCILRYNLVAAELSGVSLNDCVIQSNAVPVGKATVRFLEPSSVFGGAGVNRITNCFVMDNVSAGDVSIDYIGSAAESYVMTRTIVVDGVVRNAASIRNSTLSEDYSYTDSNYFQGLNIYRSIIGNKLHSTRDSYLVTDPLFVNPGDPEGPDGVFGTVDDGYMLQAASPAIQTDPSGDWVYGAYDYVVSPIFDIDSDGIFDTWEQIIIDANPNDSLTDIYQILPGDDFDADGVSNLDEYLNQTSPLEADSDFDGYSDRVEIDEGKDPNDRLSQPINLRPLTAVELRFFGTPGMTYQAQQLIAGENWENVADPMDGEGREQFILFSYEGARIKNAIYRVVEASQTD